MNGSTWVLDLAPHHKMGLPLRSRVLIASGMSRLGHPTQVTYDMEGVGAVVVGPWTGPEDWPPYPVLIRRPGGVLWCPPRPPRGIGQTLRRVSSHWQRWPAAIIASLGPADVGITREVARRLSRHGDIAGFLIEVDAREEAATLLARVDIVRQVAQLPVLVALPLHRASALVEPCLQAGADALVIGMPPEGVWTHKGKAVRGYVYGPLLLPLVLATLQQVRGRIPTTTPLIAQGGIHAPRDAIRCLEAGADAVALDAAVWVEPDLPTRVHRAILAWEAARAEDEDHSQS